MSLPSDGARAATLVDLKALAREVLEEGESALFELEWAATAFAVEGAKEALLTAGRRLEAMVRRMREGL